MKREKIFFQIHPFPKGRGLLGKCNKLSNYFGTDGLLHILCSIVAMTFLGFFLPLWLTIVIVLLIGIGKELIYDKLMGKGTPSWKDLLADVIGIVIGSF